jgi:acyl-CoA synthetase (AMP-forming)/AMP-acid ligase II
LALAERVRLALAERHVAPHEPVHVSIGNRPSDLGALLGIWLAGAVAVPIHALAAASTIARVQRISGARFLLDGERLDVIGDESPPDRALLRDAALVIFTSGSTGEPKGVVIGHRRLAAKLAVLDRLLNIVPDDVVLSPLQLVFIFGLWVSLLTLMKRARLILVPKFTAEAMARGLAAATVLAGVPSMFRTLLTYPGVAAPKLRAMLSGGEVLAPALAHAMTRLAPAAIHDLYGLSETGSCDFHLGPADQPQGFGTIGHPTDGVTFRIARDGVAVAAGATGELQIRTPFGMLGYLDNPALTEAAFEGGYFKTGDLARLTALSRLSGAPRTSSRAAATRLRRSRSTISWRNTQRLRLRFAPALPMSASAKSFTLSLLRARAPVWMPQPCATGCWRAPSASRCRTFSTSATRCPQAPAAKPTARPWRNSPRSRAIGVDNTAEAAPIMAHEGAGAQKFAARAWREQ